MGTSLSPACPHPPGFLHTPLPGPCGNTAKQNNKTLVVRLAEPGEDASPGFCQGRSLLQSLFQSQCRQGCDQNNQGLIKDSGLPVCPDIRGFLLFLLPPSARRCRWPTGRDSPPTQNERSSGPPWIQPGRGAFSFLSFVWMRVFPRPQTAVPSRLLDVDLGIQDAKGTSGRFPSFAARALAGRVA